MVQLNFAANQYQPKYDAGGGLPPGLGYIGMITQTSGEETLDKQGGFLALTITVLDGPLKDQTHIDRLNIHNKSQKAVQVANQQLSAYCHVTGVFQLQDTDQLCGKPFKFDVRAQRNNPEYTEIGQIYDINGNKPGQSTVQQAAPSNQPPPPPPNAGNSGWQAGGDNSGQGNGGGTTWTPPGQAGGPAPQEGPSQGGGGWSGNPNPGPAPGAGGGWNPQGGGAGGAGSGGGWAGR